MKRWEGKVAVVTGASAGIGLATCQALVGKGINVVGLARRKEKMEERMQNTKGPGKFVALKCDVANSEEVSQVFQWIKENVGVVQILVNNAGIVESRSICDTSREVWEKVFNVNVMGLLDCTKRAVNMMQEADVEGHIVNINSVLGHYVPNMAVFPCNVYPGSKFAVSGLTSTVRNELLGGKIRVTSISPGLVRTELLEANNINYDFSKAPGLESEDVADSILYVIGTPQRVQITELTIKPLGEVS